MIQTPRLWRTSKEQKKEEEEEKKGKGGREDKLKISD